MLFFPSMYYKLIPPYLLLILISLIEFHITYLDEILLLILPMTLKMELPIITDIAEAAGMSRPTLSKISNSRGNYSTKIMSLF